MVTGFAWEITETHPKTKSPNFSAPNRGTKYRIGEVVFSRCDSVERAAEVYTRPMHYKKIVSIFEQGKTKLQVFTEHAL